MAAWSIPLLYTDTFQKSPEEDVSLSKVTHTNQQAQYFQVHKARSWYLCPYYTSYQAHEVKMATQGFWGRRCMSAGVSEATTERTGCKGRKVSETNRTLEHPLTPWRVTTPALISQNIEAHRQEKTPSLSKQIIAALVNFSRDDVDEPQRRWNKKREELKVKILGETTKRCCPCGEKRLLEHQHVVSVTWSDSQWREHHQLLCLLHKTMSEPVAGQSSDEAQRYRGQWQKH